MSILVSWQDFIVHWCAFLSACGFLSKRLFIGFCFITQLLWVPICICFHLYITPTNEKFTGNSNGPHSLICLLSYLKIRLIALQAYYNPPFKRDRHKRKLPSQYHEVALQPGVQISTSSIFKDILLIIAIQPNCEFTSKNSLLGDCIS